VAYEASSYEFRAPRNEAQLAGNGLPFLRAATQCWGTRYGRGVKGSFVLLRLLTRAVPRRVARLTTSRLAESLIASLGDH
jgi:hypothetical protein